MKSVVHSNGVYVESIGVLFDFPVISYLLQNFNNYKVSKDNLTKFENLKH